MCMFAGNKLKILEMPYLAAGSHIFFFGGLPAGFVFSMVVNFLPMVMITSVNNKVYCNN